MLSGVELVSRGRFLRPDKLSLSANKNYDVQRPNLLLYVVVRTRLVPTRTTTTTSTSAQQLLGKLGAPEQEDKTGNANRAKVIKIMLMRQAPFCCVRAAPCYRADPAIQLLTEFKHSAGVSIPSGAPAVLDQLSYSVNGVELTPQMNRPPQNTHSARVFRQLPTAFLPKRTVNPRPRSRYRTRPLLKSQGITSRNLLLQPSHTASAEVLDPSKTLLSLPVRALADS